MYRVFFHLKCETNEAVIRCPVAMCQRKTCPSLSQFHPNLGRMMMTQPQSSVVQPLVTPGHLQKSYQPNCCSRVPLTVRPNVRGGVKMVICLPENIEQVGRTSTKPVSDLPLNGLGLRVEVERQVTTSALPVTNSVPIILDLVLLSMQISAM
jgi:hypothetical protein